MRSSFWPLPAVPSVLSVNAGYVDALGFLALHGLFTSHVTGNFVTLGASFIHGSSGALAKLMALPVFCVTVFCVRLLRYGLDHQRLSALTTLLSVKLLLFVLGAALALHYGPFPDADAPIAFITGMVLVTAMAIQNGLHRVHLPSAPPSTVMTGTTTQVMLDLADLFYGVSPETRAALVPRLANMLNSIVAFAAGCGAAALFYSQFGEWAFVVPPVLGALTLLAHFVGKTKKTPA